MSAINDNYILNYGEVQTMGANDLKVDLTLQTYISPTETSLNGVVLDSDNNPIESAGVVLYDLNDNPLISTETNENGEYTLLYNVGLYKVSAGKNHYLSSNMISVELIANTPTTQNITLLDDPNEGLQSIYGVVTYDTEGLSGVAISVFDENNVLVATSVTALDGEYVINKITDGNYTLTFTKLGYLTESVDATVIPGVKKRLNIEMQVDANAGLKTISGKIKDEYGEPIPGAGVFLYEIINGAETIVEETYTNAQGNYMFTKIAVGRQVFPKAK